MKLIIEKKDRNKIMEACTAKVMPIDCIEECDNCPLMQLISEICGAMCGAPSVNVETGEAKKRDALDHLPIEISTLY